MRSETWRQLRQHAPFTALGTAGGILVMLAFWHVGAPRWLSERLFWSLHPLHVLLSALVTTAMFTLHGRPRLWKAVAIGYIGSVGIATVSDSLIPYAGECLLDLPRRAVHLGFIEMWWLVNPMAIAGIGLGYLLPRTKAPHAGHVLLSTWASLFHMTMAMDRQITAWTVAPIAVFLFLAVWLPCCTSDIVFPMVFARKDGSYGTADAIASDWREGPGLQGGNNAGTRQLPR